VGSPYWWGARGHGPLDPLNPALASGPLTLTTGYYILGVMNATCM